MAASLHSHLFPARSCGIYRNRSNYFGGFGVFIRCSDSSPPNRGFGSKSKKADKKKVKSSPKQSPITPNNAPNLSSLTGGERNYSSFADADFEQRLQAVKRSALKQKKAEEDIGVIDYDVSTKTKEGKSGVEVQVGIGVAVIAFGLVFALGDFLPGGSFIPAEEATTVHYEISKEERANLEKGLVKFEDTLSTSPEDSTALEGAAVTCAQMGEYKRSAKFLEKLTEKKPGDPDAFRLLGEVKYEIKDYKGSVDAYRSAERASKGVNFEILRGLTNSLLAAKRPDEAIQVLLASREHLNAENSGNNVGWSTSGNTVPVTSDVDPIQVDLLIGKAYSDWGHITDALVVYDQLISSHPDDFRGYLAKGIILKEIGSKGDAERMFIQARFFAPDKAKALVDKYSR